LIFGLPSNQSLAAVLFLILTSGAGVDDCQTQREEEDEDRSRSDQKIHIQIQKIREESFHSASTQMELEMLWLNVGDNYEFN